MKPIKAIGFDLFDTLITVKGPALREALERLITTLKRQGFIFDEEAFMSAYRQAARQHIEDTRKDGRETHNRFWLCDALQQMGYPVSPEDPRIAAAIEQYFDKFNEYIALIPGTREMLQQLQGRYRLGLLSNFTHAPAAKALISDLELDTFFEVILISGELGYRKPHPSVFTRLREQLDVGNNELVYIGDNPEDDIQGALNAGIQPIWMVYTWKQNNNFANRFSPQPEIVPEASVPRIETWQDLLKWLENGKPEK